MSQSLIKDDVFVDERVNQNCGNNDKKAINI